MTYYLSGALASQNSASINQAITGGLPLSVNDYSTSIKENLAFDLSPNGEYMLKTTFMGTGSFGSDPGNDYDPGMIIYQSGSSNGFERAGFIKIKGSRANDSAFYYADANNLFSPRFLSDDTIVIACDSYDPQDGGTTLADGAFIVVTGSGTSWGISQIFSGSTSHSVSSTAQSRNANLGGPGVIADFAGTDDHAKMIAANNKYSSTLATRVAVHNYGGHSSGGRPQGMITIFQQSGGTWSFHSQFSQEDMSAYVQGSFSSAITVHDMTWIDENNLVVVYFADGSTDYSYMMAMTWNASTSKWEISGYSGSEMTNYTYRLTTRLSLDASTSGVQGIRFVEYDPFSERLLMGYQGDSIWMFQSQSNWLRDDLYGSGFGKGNTSEEEDHGHSGVLGFPPFGHKQHMKFAFAAGRTTIVGVQSRYGSEQSAANSGYNSLVYHESSSAGWMNYDISYANSTYQGRLRHEYFSTGSVSAFAAEPTTGFGITPWIHSRQAAEYYGAKTAFTMNSTNGGDGNTFVYHEADEASTLGSNQKDNQRLLVGNFGAFPAANPALAAFATSSIGSSGGTLSAGGTQASPKITVTVPADALSGDTSLSTEVVSTAATKSQNLHEIKKQAGSADAAFVGDIFRFTPHGQQFSKAVTIQFVLDSEPSDLTIWKRDSHDGDFTQWYELPSNLWSNSGTTVTISTTKFSEYAGIGGINVARTKISNGQLATLTTSDLIDSSALRVSGSNSFKNLTVAADDLFVIEQGGGTYHVSASQMAEYFGGLVTVSASSDNVDMRMTFVSPTDDADIGLAVDAGIKYNPSSNTLKGTNLSGSGDLTIAGNATVDDNLIVTKGYVQVAADNMHITGNILSSGLIKGTTLSGSGDLTIAGSATVDDNVVVTKGYVHVVSDNVHVTGAVLASGDIKGANISGSSALTIAGSATIDDNIVATKGYIQAAAGGLFATGAIGLKASNGADAVISTDGGGEIRMDASTNIEIGGVNGTPKIGRSSMTSQVLGHLSGAGNFSLAGNATIDDNIVTTKGYVQVVAGNVHVTGNVLAQEVKGTAISGSGNLTIAGNATIAGDFSVNGDLTYINTTNLAVEDSLILLGSGSSGTPVNDQGFILERGSAANAAVVFDESSDRFAFAYVGTASAGSTGNLDVALGAPVSASAFYGDGSNLTGVGAATVASNNDNNDLALTFVSGAGLAAATLFTDASALKYNTSTDTLKAVILSASSDITAAGNITADDNIIATKGYVQVKAGNIHLTGAMLASSHISGAGNLSAGGTLAVDGAATLRNSLTVSGGDISGSADFTLAGSATIDDNLVLTKGYVQVKADNMHITGNVLASGDVKAANLSGSGALTIAGSATIDDNAVLTKGYLQIAADNAHVTGAIFATSHVSGGGNFSAAGTLSVAGLISGSSGMDLAGTADFGGAVNVQGLLSGSGGMDMAGTADFGAAVNVQGALDVDGATTLDALTVSEAVTFTSVAALAVDSNDATHHILVTDSDDNIVKKESVTDLVQHITGAAGTRGGLQVHQGKLFIAQKEESFMSASLTGHAHTASMSGPVLSGSLMVFLNGLLQTRSGSANLGAGANSIFDYRLDSYTAPTKVLMADALDSDDVLIVRYIQK